MNTLSQRIDLQLAQLAVAAAVALLASAAA